MRQCKSQIGMVNDFIERTKQVLIDFSFPGAAAVLVNTEALKLGVSKFPTNGEGSGFRVGKAGFRFTMSSLAGEKKVFDNSFQEAQDYMILSVIDRNRKAYLNISICWGFGSMVEVELCSVLCIQNNFLFPSCTQAKNMINPFVFSNSTNANTKMTGIEFATLGGPMSVNGTTEPIEITVESAGSPPTPENVSLSVSEAGQSSYHTVEIKNTSFLLNVGIKSEARHKLYVVFGPQSQRPTLNSHMYKVQLPDNRSCEWVDTERHPDDEAIDLLRLQDWEQVRCSQNVYSFFVSDNEKLYGNYTYGKNSCLLSVNSNNC